MEHDFWTAFIVSVAATAVTTAAPAGTVVPYPLVSHIDPRLLRCLLALSAGALILWAPKSAAGRRNVVWPRPLRIRRALGDRNGLTVEGRGLIGQFLSWMALQRHAAVVCIAAINASDSNGNAPSFASANTASANGSVRGDGCRLIGLAR